MIKNYFVIILYKFDEKEIFNFYFLIFYLKKYKILRL